MAYPKLRNEPKQPKTSQNEQNQPKSRQNEPRGELKRAKTSQNNL